MKAITSLTLKTALALTIGLTGTVTAHAASTYQFAGNGTYNTLNEQYAKTSYTGTDGNLNISGVYASNLSTGVADGSKVWNANSASLPLYFNGNGLGMCSDPATSTTCNSGTANHALDNVGNTEGILLQFSTSMVLQQIGLGYVSTDSDFSVFRYTGTNTPASLSTVKANATDMTAAGWELVGNYADVQVDNTAPYTSINAAGKTSSWWLITAYNSGIAGTVSANGGSLSNNNDYFKIFAVAGTKCTSTVDSKGVCGGTTTKAPEPATLALTSVALLGVAGLRRRQAKAA